MDLISKLPLPSDLCPLISDFIRRSDWKTCRKHEADLIRQMGINLTLRLVDPVYESVDFGFEMTTTNEVRSWTLYGKRFIVKWLNSGCSRTSMDYFDRYTNWYTQMYILKFLKSY
jgi:hypothetical protein